jgi:hypothetical protein
MSPNAAYVTLLTKNAYLPGALIVDECLRSVGSQYPLVVMVTPTLPQEARDVLRKKGIIIKDVDPLRPGDGTHQLAAHDSRFADTWTKLRYVNRIYLLIKKAYPILTLGVSVYPNMM